MTLRGLLFICVWWGCGGLKRLDCGLWRRGAAGLGIVAAVERFLSKTSIEKAIVRQQ